MNLNRKDTQWLQEKQVVIGRRKGPPLKKPNAWGDCRGTGKRAVRGKQRPKESY
jgi:hypothetical protein